MHRHKSHTHLHTHAHPHTQHTHTHTQITLSPSRLSLSLPPPLNLLLHAIWPSVPCNTLLSLFPNHHPPPPSAPPLLLLILSDHSIPRDVVTVGVVETISKPKQAATNRFYQTLLLSDLNKGKIFLNCFCKETVVQQQIFVGSLLLVTVGSMNRWVRSTKNTNQDVPCFSTADGEKVCNANTHTVSHHAPHPHTHQSITVVGVCTGECTHTRVLFCACSLWVLKFFSRCYSV